MRSIQWLGRGYGERAVGMLLGIGLDAVTGDPVRFHPVAGYGRAAAGLERAVYAPTRSRGALFTAAAVGVPVAAGVVAERAFRDPRLRVVVTALATWTALGGTSLAREGRAMAAALAGGDLAAARSRMRNLCSRDPTGLTEGEVARATVESLAENSSDAAVAPLLWGAVAGVPGLLGYRAVNTLDAMVGYTRPRYRQFGWASARLDDAANLLPARVTALLTVVLAPVVGGSPRNAWAVLRRDGAAHPSPNAGRCEAAAAGALGVRLGGASLYAGRVEVRPALGEGLPPQAADIARAVHLTRSVTLAAAGISVGLAALLGRIGQRGRSRRRETAGGSIPGGGRRAGPGR